MSKNNSERIRTYLTVKSLVCLERVNPLSAQITERAVRAINWRHGIQNICPLDRYRVALDLSEYKVNDQR